MSDMWGRDNYELLKEILERVKSTERTVAKVFALDLEILTLLRRRPVLLKARITVMPKTIQVGQTATATIVGVWSDGQTRPLDSTYQVTYTAAIPGDVMFATPAVDGSAVVTGISADAGDAISAAITRPDGTVITATPDVLTITAPPPVLTGAAVVLQ